MTKRYTASKIFTGTAVLEDHAVVTENGIIISVEPAVSEPIQCAYIIPSFIDLQIYGAKGKLFSVFPTTDTLATMYAHCREGGTEYFLPTIATNTPEVMFEAIDAVDLYIKQGGKGVLGIHLEGPWINPAKRGAHINNLISKPTLKTVQLLLKHRPGIIKMITVAPEVCSKEITDYILSEGIILSAGHSNASFNDAMQGFDNGIKAVTHLFNAMSSFHHRDTGLPGAAMLHTGAFASIIADGYHVDYAAIAVAKKIMKERLFLITDAVTETDSGPYQHVREGDRFIADGILSGSSLTMLQAVKNCIKYAGIEMDEAIRMATLYPARVAGINAGEIKVGARACFELLDHDLNLY